MSNNALIFGKESVYGTGVPATIGVEGLGDSWKREQEWLGSTGFRAGIQAKMSNRSRPVNLGGTASVEVDVLDKGFGYLLQGAMSASAIGSPVGGHSKQTHSTGAGHSSVSYTAQMLRQPAGGGAAIPFTHTGCVVTSLSIAQAVNDTLKATFGFDFQQVVTSTPAGTAVYPADTRAFAWDDCEITVGGTQVCVNEFSLEMDLGMKTDRRGLCGTDGLKKRPVRVGVPAFTGALNMDFEDLTQYNRFTGGDIVAVVATWEGTGAAELKITMPAVQFTGESPEASLDDLTQQPLSCEVLWNGSQPAITIEYNSTDAAIG